MEFHGATFVGPIVIQKVTTLPTWKLEYEGRIVYNIQDRFLYFATDSAWVKSNSTNSAALDADTLDGYHADELAQTHIHTAIAKSTDRLEVGLNDLTWIVNDTTILKFTDLLLVPEVNNVFDIGTVDKKFKEVFATTFNGTATKALYADLAELYTSDVQYEPGTVVSVSTDETFDICICNEELSMNVVGIVSENPSYLMNSGLKNGLPVGLVGLLDVNVTGIVNKGDILVSAGFGCLRSAQSQQEKLFKVAIAAESNSDGRSKVKCIKS